MSTESGHHVNRVYRSQDGDLIVPYGAHINVESSGYIRNNNIVTHTSANTTLLGHGISIINASTKGTVYVMKDPPGPGAYKKIVFQTTHACKLHLSTGGTADNGNRFVGGAKSSATVLSVTSDAFYQKDGAFGIGPTLEMIATATSAWQIIGMTFPSSGAVGAKWTFATST